MKLSDRKMFRSMVIAVAVFSVSAIMYICGAFTFLENKSYDARVKLLAELGKPSEDIFVVVLDQGSLDWAQAKKGWSWPWPRSAYAEITRFFTEGGAQAIIFDVLYTEPSLYGAADDADFAQACAESGRVVHTVFFSNQYGNAVTWPEKVKKPLFTTSGFIDKNTASSLPITAIAGTKALFPIPVLAQSAGAIGNITGTPDSDSIIRRASLFHQFDGLTVQGLSFAALSLGGTNQTLTYNPTKKNASFKEKTFPAEKNGTVLLRFRKNIDSYIPYSAAEILQSREAVVNGKTPLLEPALFAGKYVFFCFYAPGLFDICATPISNSYPGAGVHITLLDNFLQNDFIAVSPLWAVLTFLAACAAAGALLQLAPPVVSAATIPAGAVLLAAIAAVAYIAGINIPFVAPLFSLSLAFGIALIISYNTESKQKRSIKSLFKQYLSPAVIEQLIAHPEQVKLGGELREISIFFSDVQGFTTISERLSPQDLTELLNDYLSAMSDIILASGGTIDKYEGDAIIAFWNAPLNQEDHARRAVEAALTCQRTLAEMNGELAKRAGTPILMRIGLNTGKAVVGNMGSHSRFDYTMLGDSVNLAARLEGQNKQFGTYTMCTQASVQAAQKHGCTVRFRELSRVAVVGKKEAVTVYEPLEAADYERKKNEFAIFAEALRNFYAGGFKKALFLFESIQEKDASSRMYALKCRELLSFPPKTWNGVWQATSK